MARWAVYYPTSKKWAEESGSSHCGEQIKAKRWTTADRNEAIACLLRCRNDNEGCTYKLVRVGPRSAPNYQRDVALACERIADRLDDLLARLPSKRELAAMIGYAGKCANSNVQIVSLEPLTDVEDADALLAELERTAK